MTEIWKPIPDYEGYYDVSNHGRVKSLARTVFHPKANLTIKERFLKVNEEPKKDYVYVFLSKDGKPKRFRVHTLVLIAFAGPCPKEYECRHLNGKGTDNRWPENLRWGTSAENKKDMIRHGGTMTRNFKLTQAEANKIRLLLSQGMAQKEVAQIYGVTTSTIGYIHRNVTWTS